MGWEPTPQEIEEKLIELAYVWGDIEEAVELRAGGSDDAATSEANYTSSMLDAAFRIEATYGENDFGDPCTFYEVLYDVADREAREAKANLSTSASLLRELILEKAQPWHSQDFLKIRTADLAAPVRGEICRRFLEDHPARAVPELEDVPTFRPESAVDLIERGPFWLTPIEAPFYDELRETGLTFAVQPWIQGPDETWRLDFLVFYDGGAVAVELDGHDYHKTKEQRGRDARRDRWFAARRIQTLRFTGSQVYADPAGCVRELLAVLRSSQARP